jgi:hypothetical protein
MFTHNLPKNDYYEIRVKGHLEPGWTDWFDGLTASVTDSGETILYGPFLDQSALHGLIAYLHNRELLLISIKRVESGEAIKKKRG